MIELVGVGNITDDEVSDAVYYSQEIPIAIFIFLFSAASLILYIIVLLGLKHDSDYKNLVAYQIMVHIGYADCLQLIAHFITGFYLLNGRNKYGTLEMIIGAVMNASWVTMLVLTILLTLNRLISITCHFESKTIFSPLATKIYLGVCWLFWLFIIVVNISPLSKFYYVTQLYTFHYEAGYPLSEFVRKASSFLSLGEVLIAIISYACIFLYIYFKAAILSKREVYLTIQVLSMAAFHVLCFLIWEYWFLPDHPLATFFGHFVWMAWNSMTAVLHIVVSPRIRYNVYEILGKRLTRNEVSAVSKVFFGTRNTAK